MAAGDAVVALSSAVANNAFVAVQPGSGVEWIIHNLYWEAAVELYWYDGTNAIKFDSDSGPGGRLGAVLEVTNATYLRVKNVSGSTQNIGYSGVVTK